MSVRANQDKYDHENPRRNGSLRCPPHFSDVRHVSIRGPIDAPSSQSDHKTDTRTAPSQLATVISRAFTELSRTLCSSAHFSNQQSTENNLHFSLVPLSPVPLFPERTHYPSFDISSDLRPPFKSTQHFHRQCDRSKGTSNEHRHHRNIQTSHAVAQPQIPSARSR